MPKRRTPQELQAHHEALAAKHAFAARVAASPALKLAIKLLAILPRTGRTPEEASMILALHEYVNAPDPE